MIENIHSHEGEEGKTSNYTFRTPKNIKQVGESTSQKKIYVEDYVFTYIKELVKKESADCRIAVLLGHYIKTQDERIILIRGAVEAEGISFDADNVFNNDTWTEVYENIKKYFNDVEVVGWCIGGPGFILDNSEKLKKIHLDNFAGVDKALMKYDSLEGEETFYIYENGALSKQEGYYIYYEKNDEMQTYMVEHKASLRRTEKEKEESIVREYKEEIKEQRAYENNRNIIHLMYATGSFMVVLAILVFVTMISNNHKIITLQKSVGELDRLIHAGTGEETNSEVSVEVADGNEGTIEVETISGNLNTIKEEKVIGDKAAEVSEKKDSEVSTDKVNETKKKVEESEEDTDQTKKEASQSKEDVDSSQEKETRKEEKTIALVKKKDEDNKESAKSDEHKDSVPVSKDANIKYYEVQEGDTLVNISFKLYHSGDYVSKIMELNGIEDMDMIYYGQKLIVP